MHDLFQFEKDKCATLQRFPMHFRLRLDLCGIKLSKRDWNVFGLSDKQELLSMPCETQEEIQAFRRKLKAMIAGCNGDSIEVEPVGELAPWKNTAAVPTSIQKQISGLDMTPPSLSQWVRLNELQRFALLKLTREGHVKKEIGQVLDEFDLNP
jgi:hypothetical protein